MRNLILTICIICLSVFISQAQETTQTKDDSLKQESLHFKVKEGFNPDVYIDGKKYDHAILDLLDQGKIGSVSVIKGEQAMKEYNAPNGVLLIKTKKKTEVDFVYIKAQRSENSKDPKVIIDGEVLDQEALSKISAKNIQSINVLKGEVAAKNYDASSGVIIVTTKKGKKKK